MLNEKIKTTVEVEEMFDVDVRRVSLVERGANKIPWRVIKTDSSPEATVMGIQFGQLFGKRAEPRVTAVAVSKDADLEVSKALIEKAGFSTKIMKETDDAILFIQEGEDSGERAVIKLDENHAVVVSGLQKALTTWPDSEEFEENMAASGFMPGINMASSLLTETIYNIVTKAEDKDAATKSITKAVTSFNSHISGLVAAIPSGAFKMEEILLSAPTIVKDEASSEEASTDTEGEATGDTATQEGEEEVKKSKETSTEGSEDAATEEVAKGNEAADTSDATDSEKKVTKSGNKSTGTLEAAEGTEDEAEEVAKAEDSDDAPAGASITDTVKAIEEALKGSLSPLTEAVKALTARVEDVEKSATKTAEAVNGTVHTAEEISEVKKNTDSIRGRVGDIIPCIDTGLTGRGGRPGLQL